MSVHPYVWLSLAIAAEVAGTLFLAASDQMTRLRPTALCLAFYALSFWLLAGSLRTIPVGVAYAIWSGLGITLIALFGRVALGQRLDAAALLGMGLIVAGVLVIHFFSRAGH